MAYSNTPSIAALRHNLGSGRPSGLPGSITVLANTPTVCTLSIRDRKTAGQLVLRTDFVPDPSLPAGEWASAVYVLSTPNSLPASIPSGIVTNVNRLLQPLGLKLHKDWRTHADLLWVGTRRTSPVRPNVVIHTVRKAANTPWSLPSVVPSGTSPFSTPAAPSPSVTPSPVAPTPSPSVSTSPTPDDSPENDDEDSVEVTVTATLGGGKRRGRKGTAKRWFGDIVVSAQSRRDWKAARLTHQRTQRPTAVCLVGPTGTGKTEAVYFLGDEEGVEVVRFDCAAVREPSDWFGMMLPTEANTLRWEPSTLYTALTEPGERILLLDEANRANGPAAQALLPVLTAAGSVTIPITGKTVLLNPKVQIAMTMNLGAAYVHTEPLDPAFRDRIHKWIEFDYLSKAQETKVLVTRTGLDQPTAEKLATFASLVRDASRKGAHHGGVSTRLLLSAAEDIVSGQPAAEAVEATIIRSFSGEGGARSERQLVLSHFVGITW